MTVYMTSDNVLVDITWRFIWYKGLYDIR